MTREDVKLVCRDVWIKVETNETPFTRQYAKGAVIQVPVAHHDGNYFADAETLETLEGDGRVAFRYVDAQGQATVADNPNGSLNNIAGIVNDAGNVLGMMPHPERLVDDTLGTAKK